MASTLTTFLNSWTDALGYALADYVNDMLIEPPLVAAGMVGRYVAQGLNFGIKQAIGVTHPFSQLGSYLKSG